jgi:hypothetical protein
MGFNLLIRASVVALLATTAGNITTNRSVQGTWIVDSIDGIEPERTQTLELRQTVPQVRVFDGCNEGSAKRFEVRKGKLILPLGTVRSTKKACPDLPTLSTPPIQATLSGSPRIRREGDKLVIVGLFKVVLR